MRNKISTKCRSFAFVTITLLTIQCQAWNEWRYAGVSHNWNVSSNWSPSIPTASQDPIMRGYGVDDYAVIGSGITAVGNTMWVGYSGRADLNITGGSLTVDAFRVSVSGGPGNVNLSGGTVTINGDTVIGDGAGGVGTLNVTGGSLRVAVGWLYVGYNGATGYINLDGGSVTTSKVMMYIGYSHLNITKGKLIITNTDSAGVATELTNYINAGELTFYNGDPRATYAFTVNGSGYTELTANLPDAEYSWNPSPVNLSAGVSQTANLVWSSGTGAISHNVYLGTSFADVNNAQRQPFDFDGDAVISWSDLKIFAEHWLNSYNFMDFSQFANVFYSQAEEFQDNQTQLTFTPSTLQSDTTYYWRVDEVAANNTYKGQIWSFTTGPIIASPEKTAINKYDSLFVDIGTSAPWTNQYNPDDIRIDACFTPPTGADIIVPCFYTGGNSGNSQWQCRFTPKQIGTYSYRIDVYQSSVLTTSSQVYTLDVSDSSADGFLRTNPSSYYTFIHDSGKRQRGIGENIGWEQGGYMYDRLFPLLHSMGCNYVRLWLANPYNVQLEGVIYGLGKYDEQIAKRMDNTVNLAKQSGIYLTLSFDGAGELEPNPTDPLTGWAKNPYNSANGGMCTTQSDFFTSASAKAQYKKKIRYIVARWGYSPNIAAFEFWNEIDGAWVHYGVAKSNVVSWHNEIAPYLKSIDPFDHIVTTSCTGYDQTNFWNLMPDIDFSQTHPYYKQSTPDFNSAKFPSIIASFESTNNKPHVLGEFGYTSGEPRNESPWSNVDALHRGLWYGMFSPTPILPQTWWWDYFEQNGDNYQFTVAAAFLTEMMRNNAELTTATASGGSNVETFAVAAGQDRFVWMRNKKNYSVSVTLTMSVPNGSYNVRYYNTSTGAWYNQQNINVTNGSLSSSAGSLTAYQDVACAIEKQ